MSKTKLTFCHLEHLPGLHLFWQLKGTPAHSLAQKLSVSALLDPAALSLSLKGVASSLPAC